MPPLERRAPLLEAPMGRVLLELVLTVENTFGFAIPDEDAAAIDTMGKLYDYILAQRVHANQQACLNSIAFYKIRRGVMSVLQIPREDVRVSTELSAIIPAHRRRVWRELEKATGLRLPQLWRPAWVVTAAIWTTVGLAVAMPVLFSLGPFRGAILVAILTAFAVGYCFVWLTVPLAVQFQPDCTTVGQLATATLARNYRAIVEECQQCPTDAEVWESLRSIVGEQLGVRPSDLTRESNLVELSE